jgi:hypothetical protein
MKTNTVDYIRETMKQTNWAACTNDIIITIFTSNISYTEDSGYTNCKQFNTHLDTENYIKKKLIKL